jgi:hypothetical protein
MPYFQRLSPGIIAVIVILVLLLVVSIVLAVVFGIKLSRTTTGNSGPAGAPGATGPTGPPGGGTTGITFHSFPFITPSTGSSFPVQFTFSLVPSIPTNYFADIVIPASFSGFGVPVIIPPSGNFSSSIVPSIQYVTQLTGNTLLLTIYSVGSSAQNMQAYLHITGQIHALF